MGYLHISSLNNRMQHVMPITIGLFSLDRFCRRKLNIKSLKQPTQKGLTGSNALNIMESVNQAIFPLSGSQTVISSVPLTSYWPGMQNNPRVRVWPAWRLDSQVYSPLAAMAYAWTGDSQRNPASHECPLSTTVYDLAAAAVAVSSTEQCLRKRLLHYGASEQAADGRRCCCLYVVSCSHVRCA